MEQPQQPRIYKVPEDNLAVLMERITRLQKRATKLGSTPIVVTEVGHEDFPAYRVGTMDGYKTLYRPEGDQEMARLVAKGSAAYLGFARRYHHLTVTGSIPKMDGWDMIGAIDAVRDTDGKAVGNVLRVLTGKEMPIQYRDVAPKCDHCKGNRRWTATYVVKHEDGTYMQIGRQCLRDFLGHANPEHHMSMAEILLEFDEILTGSEDEDNESFRRGTRQDFYLLAHILELAAAIVSKDGFSPKSSEFPTSATLTNYVVSQREILRERYPVSEHDREIAAQTQQWMLSLADKPNSSDYEQNLGVLAKAGRVEIKQFGFVCSAIPAYLRSQDRAAKIEKVRLVSNFIGEVGQRLDFTLTLTSYKYIPSDYGVRTMMRYQDEQGNVVVWWASGEQEMHIGTKITAKATVKKHEEYMAIKQTIVSRLSVMDVLENPVADAIVEGAAVASPVA